MGNKIRQAYGVGGPFIPVFPLPVPAKRAPISGEDVNYPQGQSRSITLYPQLSNTYTTETAHG